MTLQDNQDSAWLIDGRRGEMRSRRALYRRAAAIGSLIGLSVVKGDRDDVKLIWWLLVGKLVLRVTKERYESLGIVGKSKQGAYIIEVDLQEKAASAFARAKDSFGRWDKAWDVWVIGGKDGKRSVFPGSTKLLKQVIPESIILEDVFVPSNLPVEQEDEAWAEIFEWVGLCTLGTRGSPRWAHFGCWC
ncbi:hypothetical protein FRC06_004231 [Ceratobasidium sp. 370]|nr:hypothetical protein FRC06_004231 [Ceratobasidium sp. 370]